MKSSMLIGIVLIVLAVLAFSYQGITYTKREKVLDIGPDRSHYGEARIHSDSTAGCRCRAYRRHCPDTRGL